MNVVGQILVRVEHHECTSTPPVQYKIEDAIYWSYSRRNKLAIICYSR